MKNTRRGLGKGMGSGYYNLMPMDSHIHSLSAKGIPSFVRLSPQEADKMFKGSELSDLYNGFSIQKGKKRYVLELPYRKPSKRFVLPPTLPKGSEKIYKMEVKFLPKDWELVTEYWSDTDAHILVGKTNGKYMILRTFMIGDKAGTSVDYRNLDVEELPVILTQRKYVNKLTAKGLTSAQRHNRRQDKIMEQARELPSSLNKYYWRQGKVVKRKK